jgi:hypothetical protein
MRETALTASERMLLFCVASNTDWKDPAILGEIVTTMVVTAASKSRRTNRNRRRGAWHRRAELAAPRFEVAPKGGMRTASHPPALAKSRRRRESPFPDSEPDLDQQLHYSITSSAEASRVGGTSWLRPSPRWSLMNRN